MTPCAISIHALHEESDKHGEYTGKHTAVFQSTLSMRRATRIARTMLFRFHFNPRSP